jgi:polyphosphate glucokinase
MGDARARLGIDIGGSSIKGALVDEASGEILSERVVIPTPPGFEFDDVVEGIVEVAQRHAFEGAFGVGFPAVLARGVVKSRPTAHAFEGWIGRNLEAALCGRHGAAVTVMNDADAAGLAEMRLGAGRGQTGVVLVFTLGTGVGSALFVDGMLVPNTELGKLYLENAGGVAELSVASRLRTEDSLSWEAWGARRGAYLRHVEELFSPDLIIVGGGVSADADRFLPGIRLDCELRPAGLRNDAGIVGAAFVAGRG